MVGSAHNNAHFIGRFAVFRVVGIESPSPHGGPHEVSFETENEFEHLFVEAVVAIVGAKGVFHPRCEARCLVVEEDAAVLYGRFSIGEIAVFDEYAVVMSHGNVGPVVPRRHANLSRQLINAIDGASAVAAGNHQLSANGGDEKHFVLPLQPLTVYLLLFYQLSDGRRIADGTGQNGTFGSVAADAYIGSAYALQVVAQVDGRPADAFQVVVVHMDGYLVVFVQQKVS